MSAHVSNSSNKNPTELLLTKGKTGIQDAEKSEVLWSVSLCNEEVGGMHGLCYLKGFLGKRKHLAYLEKR